MASQLLRANGAVAVEVRHVRGRGPPIVDPWVAERMTLVAEQRRRVVACSGPSASGWSATPRSRPTWLIGQAADWLRLARVDRLLDYAWPEEQDRLALLRKVGFRELTRTARGWVHRPGPTAV